MESLNTADLEKLILERKAIPKDKLESILNFVKQENIQNNISCQYILVKNTGDSIREQDLLKILYDHMVMFVVDFGEYRNIEGLEVSEIIAKISEILRKAKSKFQTKTKKTGEVAELILFIPSLIINNPTRDELIPKYLNPIFLPSFNSISSCIDGSNDVTLFDQRKISKDSSEVKPSTNDVSPKDKKANPIVKIMVPVEVLLMLEICFMII